MLGYPPVEQTPPSPWSRHPLEQTPPRVDTPPSRHPPADTHPQEQTPPRADTPQEQTPPSAEHSGRYGQHAGGTHPTGMQSCLKIIFNNVFQWSILPLRISNSNSSFTLYTFTTFILALCSWVMR